MTNTGENTYLLNQEHPTELARLLDLDRMITQAMGGAACGLPDLPPQAHILDLACGPGAWVQEMAQAFPKCDVAGVDISQAMINYACMQSRSRGVLNASFGVMDITHPLDFSDETFDLLNTRFLVAVLLCHHWNPFLKECLRLLKPGGTLRLTEPFGIAGISSSHAYNQIIRWAGQALWKSGHSCINDPSDTGLTMMLPTLMRQCGFSSVRQQAHVIDFSFDQQESWTDMKWQLESGATLLPPVLQKMHIASQEESAEIYQHALRDMYQENFRGTLSIVSHLGEKPLSSPSQEAQE